MVDAAALVRAGKLEAAAVDAADGAAAAQALAAATVPEQQGALAIAAGKAKVASAKPALVALLGAEGLPGRAAAWALAQLGAEGELLASATGGKLDARENGYFGLMVLAARGAASPALAQQLASQVDAEIAKARSGGTGLGEHACRVLAILGAKGTDELIQKVIENDRFCDRFELQRLRKAVQDGGRDQDSVRDLGGAWTAAFADQLAPPPEAPKPAAAPAASPLAGAKPAGGALKAPPGAALKPPIAGAKPAAPKAPPPTTDEAEFDETAPDAEEAPPSGAKPVDWKAFLASPEAAALTPQVKSLITQLGPVLEQLAARAIQAPLADLSGQELAGLLLQVLPQALPPQAVQAALSPQALNGYQALARFLARTGAATNGEDLVAGIRLVRHELAEQMRRSGILGGPDYSDPEEPKAGK